MKSILALLAFLALTAFELRAQNKGGSYTIRIPLNSANPPAVPETKPPPADKQITKEGLKELLDGKIFTNSVGMEFSKISASLWAGKYFVTQEEYQKVAATNPSKCPGQRNPVDSVSWNDAIAFCKKLTELEAQAGMLPEGFAYALPTQDQWESLVAGAELKDAVTSMGGNRSCSAPVGSLAANSLGLYDIRGNLWEWCLDTQDQANRVLRGASWRTNLEVNTRLEPRYYDVPDGKLNIYGFRCILQPVGK